jgi:hypothetical protein
MGELVIGRIVMEQDGSKAIEPLHKTAKQGAYPELALHHQRVMAALIAAAYAYKTAPTAQNLVKLGKAASALGD